MLAFPLLPLTGPVVLEALRGVREHMLSYHDAQIWAVARLGQVAVVLSEDFKAGGGTRRGVVHQPAGPCIRPCCSGLEAHRRIHPRSWTQTEKGRG